MSEGQARVYRYGTKQRLRKIDSVGSEVTTTTHDVTCGGDAIVAVKEVGVTPEVGDYVISVDKVGWATETTPLTHLTAAIYASMFYRPVNLG